MQVLKYLLIAIGIISIVLFISLLVIGVKVVSTVLLYVVGAIAFLSLVGFVLFYIGKMAGRNNT